MQQANDFFIVGPDVTPNNGVAEAITSLAYLPAQFKLLLPLTSGNVSFFNEIKQTVQGLALGARVQFIHDTDDPQAHAVLMPEATPTDLRDERVVVSRRHSPEALANAIMDRARSLASRPTAA